MAGEAGMILSMVILTVSSIWFSIAYNGVKKLKKSVDEAFATMDVHLEKRYDLIPNIEHVVYNLEDGSYDSFEKVLDARDAAWNSNSWQERFANENKVTDVFEAFMEESVNYPALHSNKNFIKYAKQFVDIEEDIANSKKYYNTIAKAYNSKLRRFPELVYAKMLGYRKRPFFPASVTEKQNNITIGL